MGFWFRWGGILVGAISLFSLMQKLGNFDLIPVFNDLLDFYHAVLHPIANAIANAVKWLFSLIGISIPSIDPDIIVIYTLLGAALLRFTTLQLRKDKGDKVLIPSAYLLIILELIVWPFVLVSLARRTEKFGMLDDDRTLLIGWSQEIGITLIAFIALFATNAYLSS